MNKSSSVGRGVFASAIHVRDYHREYVNKPLDPRDCVASHVRSHIKVRRWRLYVSLVFICQEEKLAELPWKNLPAASPLIAAAASPRISFYDSPLIGRGKRRGKNTLSNTPRYA
jgi:hypothetical protein